MSDKVIESLSEKNFDNPGRINSVLELVSEYWKLHPELRFGELVTNIATLATNNHKAEVPSDVVVFYVSDAVFELELEHQISTT